MYLKFRGFPADSWKADQEGFLSGYGTFAKGDTLNVDEATAQELLESELFDEATAPETPAPTETQTVVLQDQTTTSSDGAVPTSVQGA